MFEWHNAEYFKPQNSTEQKIDDGHNALNIEICSLGLLKQMKKSRNLEIIHLMIPDNFVKNVEGEDGWGFDWLYI